MKSDSLVQCVPEMEEVNWFDFRQKTHPHDGDLTLVKVRGFEEKGTDVNLASRLLIDTLTEKIDAAIVVSNDSDLAYPVKYCRARIPVAIINPRGSKTATVFKINSNNSLKHWNSRLNSSDFYAAQLPNVVGPFSKPEKW